MSAQVIHLPRFGATPSEWAHFDVLLGLSQDLLPVVSNPNATISPNSDMKKLGKTPSRYNGQGQAVGIAKWTSHYSTSADLERWSSNRDFGICLQTRRVRALDVDIPDPTEAAGVRTLIAGFFPGLPTRTRADSSKFLHLIDLPGDFQKRIIRTEHGMVEFLAQGQQCIVAGQHEAGCRYEWLDGLPDEIPTLTKEQFEVMWAELERVYSVEPSVTAKTATKAQRLADAPHNDPTAKYLLDNDWVKSFGKDGSLNVRCPFEAEHTTEGAESATTYFPAHTGGYERGHFHCLHAHCAHRADGDYRDAIGIPSDDFADFDVVEDSEAVEGEPVVRNRFEVVQAAEFAKAKQSGWIVKKVLPKAGLAVVFGESGSGKSFWALDIAMSVVLGTPWREHKVKQGGCVYIAAEGSGGFGKRLLAYSEYHQIDLADLQIGFIGEAPNFMLVPDIKDVLRSIKKFGNPSIIIVDTWAQVLPGCDENSGADMGKALAHCKILHEKTGAMVVLIHHSGKDTSKGARGWSGLRAAADCEIEITSIDRDHVATLTKLKDGEHGASFGFKLPLVEVGIDEDKDPVVSCAVAHTDGSVKGKRKAPLKDVEKIAWRVFKELSDFAEDGVRLEELKEVTLSQMVFDNNDERACRAAKAKVVKAAEKLGTEGWVRVEGTRLYPVPDVE